MTSQAKRGGGGVTSEAKRGGGGRDERGGAAAPPRTQSSAGNGRAARGVGWRGPPRRGVGERWAGLAYSLTLAEVHFLYWKLGGKQINQI